MKIGAVGTDFFRANRRTDRQLYRRTRHDEASSPIPKFYEKTKIIKCHILKCYSFNYMKSYLYKIC